MDAMPGVLWATMDKVLGVPLYVWLSKQGRVSEHPYAGLTLAPSNHC